MNIYTVKVREVGDLIPLCNYAVLAEDLTEAMATAAAQSTEEHPGMSTECCGIEETVVNVILPSYLTNKKRR